MNQMLSGSSALAGLLVSRGWTPEVWALYSSGEIFKGEHFVYAMVIMGSFVISRIWDYDDRQQRRLAMQDAISKKAA